ncbi:saccharopine dehydrogenase family protein [Nitrospina gracilis]|uniref:saccharopine dehydrogenase family protein n=1 Tax=Nitrospina gracilis TaxID=35801 RepID=UPI001F3D5852|nr:saccharopine dehydrogenase C-terminal domain-containing protein [Nitrospina gracilis]MCF8719163.1 saccharopine dehydrogenase-like NADP-dependent oxidoreductase [Nitrospina gracilis Nb-211]
MSKKIESVLVIGLGKVGRLVGILLHESGFNVTGLDSESHEDLPFAVRQTNATRRATLQKQMRGHDAVVSCLPYHLNALVAECAHAGGLHYFDLTEDVATTAAIRTMARKGKGVLAPQCGLAPGYISIVGAELAKTFKQLRSIELRVGALPQNPSGLLGYAFNWSPEGVVNEYLNDCDVIQDGQRAQVPAMENLETVVIDGVQLEAFSTSGGLGTMCETYDGKVERLNYKTIRYPGHNKLMRFFFNELHLRNDRKMAGEILVHAKPPVNDDVVFVYAAVEGWRNQKLGRTEFVRSYYPRKIAGSHWRAISWTTAASVCAVVELVSQGDLPQSGFLKQETIPLDLFFKTKNGAMYDEKGSRSGTDFPEFEA